MAKKRKTPEEDPPPAKQVINLDDDDDDQEEEQEQETSSSSSEEESSSEESSSSSEEEEESSSEEEEDSSDDDSSSSSDEEEKEGLENDDESSKKDKVRKLLEPFSKDQIVAFLKEEALNDPSILSRIVQKAESDPTHRKIFIHGLAWDATEEQVLQVFKPFGEIEEFKLITDKATGRAKGYAFAQFKTRAAAEKALKIPQKKIGNRTASCQLAALGPAAAGGATAAEEVSKRKLFVANVGPNVHVDRLRDFFGKFGEIEDGPLGLDPSTNKPRGFSIFVYKSVDGLKKALEEPLKMFEGCQLNCKKFVEGLNSSSGNNNSSSSYTQQNQSDVNYGFGINLGDLGQRLNAGGMLMPQNLGLGLAGNPMMASVLNQSGLAAAAMPGIGGIRGNYGMNNLSPSTVGLNQSGLAAAMAGMMGNYGMNSLSPGMIGNYSPQAALQRLGVFHSAQTGQSSVGANAAAVGTGSTQTQSVIGPSGLALPSYFGQL